MSLSKSSGDRDLIRELYAFYTISMVAGAVFGLYYGIFLYRNSFDIKVLVIDSLLVGIST